MFICKNCLEKDFKNQYFTPVPSYGPCEMCKTVQECQDTPSKYLVRKEVIDIFTGQSIK